MEIQKGTLLKDFTTFRTGGPAQYFCRVKSLEDLRGAVLFIRQNALAFFALGGGSNLLALDGGFSGLVLKIEIPGVEFTKQPEKKDGRNVWRVVAGAGESWDGLVAQTAEKNLAGLENLSLIPGTVGAAPIQNINAYGRDMKDTLVWVEAFHTETLETRTFSNEECQFGYRASFFQTPEGRKYIVTRVAFDLAEDGAVKADYKDVQEYFTQQGIANPSIQDVRDAVVAIRTRKLPSVKEYGTAGSFFKNPIVEESVALNLKEKYPEMPSFPAGEGKVKLLAGWILDHVCGFRGAVVGNVGAYKNQALVVVNLGDASSEEILAFVETMKKSVFEKTGVHLEAEVQMLGEK